VCWATNHGVARTAKAGEVIPGAEFAGWAEGGGDTRSLSLIAMSGNGTAFFGVFEYPGDFGQIAQTSGPLVRESTYASSAKPMTGTVLDTQGRKGVPHACLSCHGGRYDPQRRLVVGASLLPLLPAQLTFTSPQARAASEESMRRINQIVLESTPSPALRAQITALYGGSPTVTGTRAIDTAVPAGWTQQAGLYRQVIEPYCSACHFAQTGPLNFGSWANLLQNKQAVQRSVCTDFTMPHSEVSFRRFWSEGGAVSLPGLLSTVLGFSKCPT
jgi:hypothetical protein